MFQGFRPLRLKPGIASAQSPVFVARAAATLQTGDLAGVALGRTLTRLLPADS
jgi:hypothetical protein